MYPLVRERHRHSSEVEVFKPCVIDRGLCMNRIHTVEFVAKPEENLFLCQILSKN